MSRILSLLCIAAMPAHAQQCAPLPDILAGLFLKYQEQVRVQALAADGNLIVVTASPTGAWTALLVTPQGLACMTGFGEALQVIEPEPAGVDG